MNSDLKVKICGMTESGNIQEVQALRPDLLGFVFYERSPRNVEKLLSPEFIASLKVKGLSRAGVFVNSDPEVVSQLISACRLDYVQLHGDESEHYLAQIKAAAPEIKIIKVFRVNADFDFSLLSSYRSVDYFLFDTFKAGVEGGTGETFDWSILQQYQLNLPYFLSGGLGLENIDVALAWAKSDPRVFGLDFNSGVELSPGIKDLRKCAEILRRVHG